jgi:hypothetical protein
MYRGAIRPPYRFQRNWVQLPPKTLHFGSSRGTTNINKSTTYNIDCGFDAKAEFDEESGDSPTLHDGNLF